jgi:hypothetical protein
MKIFTSCIILLFIFASCSTYQPTLTEQNFINEVRDCFAEPEYILLRQKQAVKFLRGETDYSQTWFLFHNEQAIIDAENALVSDLDNISISVRRLQFNDKSYAFNFGENRPLIRPWLLDCEFMRENYIFLNPVKF